MVYMPGVANRAVGGTHEYKIADSRLPLAGSNSRRESGLGPSMLDTITDLKKPDGLHSSHPLEHLQDEHGVSVDRAEADFAELNREFSRLSRDNRDLSRVASQTSQLEECDLEKYPISSSNSYSEPWDLEQTLRGRRNEDELNSIKSKRVGVIWNNLTVRGIGGVKNIVKTFPDAFVSFFNVPETLMHILGYGKNGKEFDILKNFRGVVKPGEMVLVLGRPGSGCTTFLKVIANQRFGYVKIDGKVLYGPYDSGTFEKAFTTEKMMFISLL